MRPLLDLTWRPKLRVGVRIAPADGQRWQIRSDFDGITFLEGDACARALPWLVPLLDGTRTVAHLLRGASDQCSPEDLQAVLQCFQEQGILTEATSATSPLDVALEAMAPVPGPVRQRLTSVDITVCGHSLLADYLVRSFETHGFGRIRQLHEPESWRDGLPRDEPPHSILPIVVEPDWLPEHVGAFNQWALANLQPWLILGAWNRRVLVGPLFVPDQTACYECYRKRLASHRQHLAAFQALDAWRSANTAMSQGEPVLPAIAELTAAWASLEVFAYVTGLRPARILGRVLVYQHEEMRLEVETVLRLPWCPRCSPSDFADKGRA